MASRQREPLCVPGDVSSLWRRAALHLSSCRSFVEFAAGASTPFPIGTGATGRAAVLRTTHIDVRPVSVIASFLVVSCLASFSTDIYRERYMSITPAAGRK